MALSAEQIKGRLGNVAKQNSADARILLRIYIMLCWMEKKYGEACLFSGLS